MIHCGQQFIKALFIGFLLTCELYVYGRFGIRSNRLNFPPVLWALLGVSVTRGILIAGAFGRLGFKGLKRLRNRFK